MLTQPATSITDYSSLERTVFERARVRQLQAFVVGAGALGNEVVKALGLIGTGKITVVDPDVVEPSNLTRSIFFRAPESLGSNKALALARTAAETFPDTAIVGMEQEITGVGFQDVASADILFSCVDSDLARLEIAYISTKLNVPVADAGLGIHNYSRGRVSLFPGKQSACYGCRLTSLRRRELLTLWESATHSCWTTDKNTEERTYPSTPTMAAIVGGAQVELGLRRLFESRHDASGVQATTVEITLDPAPKLETFSVPLSRTCAFHVTDGALVPAPKSSSETTVEELLETSENGNDRRAVLVLDWPICSGAGCAECGLAWSPMQRLGAFRKRGTCPSCGCRQIAVREIIQTVGRDSPWVGATLSQLGLPDRHLHTVRFHRGGSR